MVLPHEVGSDAISIQELDAGHRAEIVIDGMPEMKIGVEIGPAERYGDFEFRQFRVLE